jgi:hypothetical protein
MLLSSVAMTCSVSTACMIDPPLAEVGELDDLCEGTQPEHACITLLPRATDEVMEALADTEGALAWALYPDGEVGPLGPGAPEGWVIAGEYMIDLAGDRDSRKLTIVDFDPGCYQVLAYFRPMPLKEPGEGDALTLPTSGFEAPPDAHTRVEVELDKIR